MPSDERHETRIKLNVITLSHLAFALYSGLILASLVPSIRYGFKWLRDSITGLPGLFFPLAVLSLIALFFLAVLNVLEDIRVSRRL